MKVSVLTAEQSTSSVLLLLRLAYSTEHTMLTWIANIKDNVLPQELLSSSQPTDINKRIIQHLYPNSVKDFEIPDLVEYLPYDLIEFEVNHRLVKPNHTNERYIAYDYFKKDNIPIEIENIIDKVDINLNVEKNGVFISFTSLRNVEYKLYKEINDKKILIASIKDKTDLFEILDNDVFQFEAIKYYIENENNQKISEIYTVRPKDYLVNLLNNQILSGKNKWYI